MHVKYPVIFVDIELPGIAPAPDNGWNSVYTSPCSGGKRPATSRPPWTAPSSTALPRT